MFISVMEDLHTLCACSGCGNQTEIAECAQALLRPFMDEISMDVMGNVIGIRHSDKPDAKTIMLEAHMDEIGFLVTDIDNLGFIHVAAVGGVDTRVLAAQSVIVHGDKPYNGVFCSIPPHLSGDDKKLPVLDDMGIDVGMTSEQARLCIPLGSRVTFPPNFSVMNDNLAISKSLDNRSGMAAVLHCLRQLKKRDVTVAVAFCVQEELGCRGAGVAARQIKPDVALVTDVSFAQTHDSHKHLFGILGGGAMIGVSPILREDIAVKLFSMAKDYKIPTQTEVMASSTGTDADQINVANCGVPCALLSIPLRYMHTPNEMVDVRDVSAVGCLMALFIEEGMA